MQLHSNIIGEGEPLIILHGFLGSGDNWKTLGKQFAKAGFEVHLVDQRNHGRSFHSDAFNYELLVTDLKEYAIAHEINYFSLLGHSMGGKTAMLFACEYPEMIHKLLIADMGIKFYPQHHQVILEGLTSLISNSDALSSRKKADEFLSLYIKEIGVRMFLLKNLYWKEPNLLGLRVNLDALIANIEEIGKALSASKTYNGDTLFLKGDRSEYILEVDESSIKKAFAKAQIKTIPKAGHWLHAENPADFYQEVINFL